MTIRKHAPALAGATDLGIVLAGEPPEESFSAFFRRTYRNLVGYLLVSGVPFDLAEEAAQEAMIAAYRRWDDLANPGAWVRKVADRQATRHAVVRRRQLGTLSDGAGHGEPAASASGSVSGSVSSSASASAEEKDWILETLARLPPGQRATMALFFDQYSTVEIAKRLGTTQTNVRSNLRHARYKLRQLLQGHQDAGTPAATHHREGQNPDDHTVHRADPPLEHLLGDVVDAAEALLQSRITDDDLDRVLAQIIDPAPCGQPDLNQVDQHVAAWGIEAALDDAHRQADDIRDRATAEAQAILAEARAAAAEAAAATADAERRRDAAVVKAGDIVRAAREKAQRDADIIRAAARRAAGEIRAQAVTDADAVLVDARNKAHAHRANAARRAEKLERDGVDRGVAAERAAFERAAAVEQETATRAAEIEAEAYARASRIETRALRRASETRNRADAVARTTAEHAALILDRAHELIAALGELKTGRSPRWWPASSTPEPREHLNQILVALEQQTLALIEAGKLLSGEHVTEPDPTPRAVDAEPSVPDLEALFRAYAGFGEWEAANQVRAVLTSAPRPLSLPVRHTLTDLHEVLVVAEHLEAKLLQQCEAAQTDPVGS